MSQSLLFQSAIRATPENRQEGAACFSPAWAYLRGKNSHLCTVVDEPDASLACAVKWYLVQGYATSARSVGLHRMLLGATEYHQQVDHENGNKLDNRRGNLRIATHSQNARNRRASKNQRAGGYKGVSWIKRDSKWLAGIHYEGKSYRLGQFATAEEAARVYDAKARELFGEFAACNFPVGT